MVRASVVSTVLVALLLLSGAVMPASAAEIWSVPISASTATEGSNTNLAFGIDSAAGDGFDIGKDMPHPPQAPQNTFDAYFVIVHPLFPQLDKDYRAPADVVKWVLHLESQSEEITLEWDPSGVPPGVSLLMTQDELNIDMKQVNSVVLPSGGYLLTISATATSAPTPISTPPAPSTPHPTPTVPPTPKPTTTSTPTPTPTQESGPGGGTVVASPTPTSKPVPTPTTAPTTPAPTATPGVLESVGVTTENGIVTADMEVGLASGAVAMRIFAGTKALTSEGTPLQAIHVQPVKEPPPPPPDCQIIGIPYDFGPAGATFDPPIVIVLQYDPATLPRGCVEENLSLAYYDTGTGLWIELLCEVDAETDTVTAWISHFTTFAVLTQEPPPAFVVSNLVLSATEVMIDDPISISVDVKNVGVKAKTYPVSLRVNGVVEQTQNVTLAGGASTTASFTLSKDAQGTYTVEVDGLSSQFTVSAPKAGLRRYWIGLLILLAVVVAVFILFLMQRRLGRRLAR